MNKGGASNVEFVIAFILFITVVVISLFLFNPTKDVKAMEQSSSYVIGKVMENATVEEASYSVKINQGCDSIVAFEVDQPIERKARVENYYGEVLPSKRSDKIVSFDRRGNDFAIILLSEDFNESTLPSGPTGSACYTLATYALNRLVSEKRLVQLNYSYYADYNSLKKQMDIPENINFDFVVTFSDNSTIRAERNKPTTIDIFANSKRVEVIKTDGTSDFADIVTRIW